MSKDIDSEFFELRNKLTKAERKKINNQIARERIEKDGAIRKLGNIAERTASILGGTGNNIPYVSSVDSKRFIELAKKELDNRKGKNMGGILEDERVSYGSGELVGGQKKLDANKDGKISGEDFELLREEKQEGGMMNEMPEEMNQQMSELMQSPNEPEQEMIPDEEMEDNYIDFILDEALSEEEEDMLMSKLEQDEQLSMLFDKVIEVASEFAGSGPVEGPGSGVSDSIPARLSDGEFVFTANATEQIGADELMRMMKDAEADADRQGMQEGGMMMEEEEVDQFGKPIDSDIARDELKKNMMSVNPRYR